MNYIDLIKGFWRSHDVEAFPTNAIALYFYLLEVNNKASWIPSFKRNNSKICADLGITYPTLSKCRNRLKQAGLIDFKTVNGNANVTYQILTFKNIFKVSNEVSDEVASEVSDEVRSRFGTGKDKQKPKQKPKTNDTPVSPEGDKQKIVLDLIFIEPEYEKIYLSWLDYRKSIRQSFKNQKTLEANYNLLKKLAGNDPMLAEEIVNQSIANQYQGLFPLKNQRYGQNTKATKQSVDQRRDSVQNLADRSAEFLRRVGTEAFGGLSEESE